MTDSNSETRDAGDAGAVGVPPVDWLRVLDAHAEIHGFHLPLGERHGALFTEDDDTLLVTFEDARAIRAAGQPLLPEGLTAAGRDGWSHLCLYCEGDTFFRDPKVITFFDSLADEGFFDHFERVVFHGTGPCGYAAAAFSVTAPGAAVVLVRPIASLAPDVAGWDSRRTHLRRIDFGGAYGFAPQMTEAAESVALIYDPMVLEDAMHAALFSGAQVLRLPCPHLGPEPEVALTEMDILTSVLRDAGKRRLDSEQFYRLYRTRRSHLPYLRRVLERLHATGRSGLLNLWVRGIKASVRRGGTTGQVP